MVNENQGHVVIIGGGQAGATVAKALLAYGYKYKITLVCEEPHFPYERPPLSKAVLSGAQTAAPSILPDAICAADTRPHQLDIKLGRRAVALDRSSKSVTLLDGETLIYDKLVIATGGTPRRLPLEPSIAQQLHYLRTAADAAMLQTALKDAANVLIIGGGWIGLETAATARMMGKKVVVLEAGSQLCSRSLPPAMAEFLRACHSRNGVDVRLDCRLDRLDTDDQGKLRRAVLSDGSSVAIDMAIVGIGLIPDTGLAQTAGLQIRSGVVIDDEARTSDPDIYAAGDVAEGECQWHGASTRIESWHNANSQAAIVAASIAGQSLPQHDPPWFWSDQFGLNIQIVGVPRLADEVVSRVHDTESILSVYFRRGEICGAISINRARDLRMITQTMKGSRRIDIHGFRETGRPLQDIIRTAAGSVSTHT